MEHVFFNCIRFEEERETLQRNLQQQLSPDNIVGEMLASETTWNAVSHFAAVVIRKLRQAEIRRDHSPT